MRTAFAFLPGFVLIAGLTLASPSSAQTYIESPNVVALGNFAEAMSALGDVNGDGYEDYAVGAPGESTGASPDDAGRVYILSGADNSVLHTLASPNEKAFGYFGMSVAGVGDVSGDSIPDVLVGAYSED